MTSSIFRQLHYLTSLRRRSGSCPPSGQERDEFSFSRKKITNQWMDVFEDVQKEHEKEIGKLKKVIVELVDLVAGLKNRNAELDEKRKQALGNYYETAAKLEDALGLIVKPPPR